MIDYEKLKLAHDLAKEKGIYLQTNVATYSDGYQEIPSDGKIKGKYFSTLDELIAILKDTKQPEPKYKINDQVWFINDEYKCQPLQITKIEYDQNMEKITYCDMDNCWWTDEQIYPTKLKLIEAQIEYWEKLKYEENNGPSFVCDPELLRKLI